MNKKQLHKIVDKCVAVSLKEGKILPAKVKQCIKLLKQLSREEAIISLKLYQHDLQRALDQSTLTIQSAVKLSALTVQAITDAVAKHYKINQITTILNPSLLGGLRLKIGDIVIDDSVSAKIDQIKERISA